MDLKNARFENLPRSTQMLIFGVLAVGLSAAVYMLYLKDLIDQRGALKIEVENLETTVAKGNAFASRLVQFKKELDQLEQTLRIKRNILPSQKETPVILQRVQEMAASSNLKIMKFTPQVTVPRAFYSDWPILLSVEGSYDALGHFFSKISQSTRIINVETISIKGIEGSLDSKRTLSATCTATTFVFRDDQLAGTGN